MSERVGVVNLHLVVDVSEHNTMTTLYKIGQGFVKEQHYGLALARVIDLPPQVLEVAEKVSHTLDAQAAAKKKSSKAFALAKRRKLVLSLKETLKQAESSPMDDDVLLNWLRKLQEEFVRRMEKLDTDTRSDTEGSAEDEEDSPMGAGLADMEASDDSNLSE
jgi:DNA mismatch repair protein MSH4